MGRTGLQHTGPLQLLHVLLPVAQLRQDVPVVLAKQGGAASDVRAGFGHFDALVGDAHGPQDRMLDVGKHLPRVTEMGVGRHVVYVEDWGGGQPGLQERVQQLLDGTSAGFGADRGVQIPPVCHAAVHGKEAGVLRPSTWQSLCHSLS